jgi:hypothetical protein
MRRLLFSAAVIVGVGWGGLVPATANPLAMPGFNSPNVEAATVKNVGYRRRQYRRYGYPVPYAYYPPAYGYYAPPPAYTYPPAYDSYAPPPAYGDYGDYPLANGDYGDYPLANGDYGEYPPANGY